MIPIYLLLTLLIRKNELERMKEEYSYSWDRVFNWNVWLVVYIVLSFSLMFAMMFWVK